jgi:uncharacterized protein GlcG (DUF336 family)
VVDDGGNLMALERLDGTFSAGANISIGKARTAVMFKKPTRFFKKVLVTARNTLTTSMISSKRGVMIGDITPASSVPTRLVVL